MIRLARSALILVALAIALGLGGSSFAFEDCNGNGVDDADDIAGGTSLDCNENGIPDECDTAVAFVHHSIASDSGTQRAELADLDGDDDLDVLFTASLSDRIAWVENLDGAGTFGVTNPIAEAIDGPRPVRAADLDGDDDLDIVFGAADQAGWLENVDGTGSFGIEQILLQGSGEVADVLAADVDGDVDLDVIVALMDADVVVWFENTDGAGSFGGPVQVGSIVGDGPRSVAAADVDDDGDLDLIVASRFDDAIRWFENLDGTGSFGAPPFVIRNVDGAESVAVAPIDDDGDLDIVAALELGDKVVWWENLDGEGGYGWPHVIATPDGPMSAAPYDIDGDGDADVVAGSFWDDEAFWHENEFGAFVVEHTISGSINGPRWFAVGDVDRNGTPDVLAAASSNISWYENTSADCNANGVPDGCDIDAGTSADCNENGSPDECDIAGGGHDCNANGAPDACDVSDGSSIDCTSDGIPDECEPDCNGNSNADSCDIDQGVSADCDEGGVPDECEADCNGNDIQDSCDIDSGFSIDCTANGIPDECETDCNGNSIADSCEIEQGLSDDCDADGVPDQCQADCNGNSQPDTCDIDRGEAVDCNGNRVPDQCDVASGVHRDCNRNGVPDTCDAVVRFAEQPLSNPVQFRRPQSLAVVDLDGDEHSDILVGFKGFTHAEVRWYKNNGQGTFGPSANIAGQQLGSSLQVARAADLDGDGDLDVFYRVGIASIVWSENLGPGWFSQRVTLSNEFGGRDVHAADLDGDGDLDLVGGSYVDLIWIENLDGVADTFSAPQIIGPADYMSSITPFDIDQDGDLDIVAASTDDDIVSWYENDDTVFQRHIIATDVMNCRSVAVADVDGDGDPDVLWTSPDGNILVWHANLNGEGSFGWAQAISFQVDDPWSIVPVDLDGDGDPDLLSISRSAKEIVWFENTGGHFGAPQVLEDDARTEWAIGAGDVDGDGDPDVLGSAGDESIAWYRNNGDDCNANGILDSCEPDCNANGFADGCDISTRTSVDCNGNGSPDECDSACQEICDADGDGCLDDVDSDAGNPFVCGDSDTDGCEDCSGGSFAPEADGLDTDGDLACDIGDCDPLDGTVWAEPGAATSLAWSPVTTTVLGWLPPVYRGAEVLTYDTLRSPVPSDFFASGACVESDATDTDSFDDQNPDSGQVFHYLIRTENACPGGTGTMGEDSAGTPRSGKACP